MTYLIHREMSPRVLARYWRMYSPQGRAMRPVVEVPHVNGTAKHRPIILVADDGTETAIEGAPRWMP